MTTYKIVTEKYDLNGKEGWHAALSIMDGGESLVHGADGDNESEAITITVTQALGNLPSNFPRSLIGDD